MYVSFGERLKRLREQKPMGLRELARTAEVPVSTLSYLEAGTRDGEGLTLATATRLARALGVDLNYLSGFYEEAHDR
jgi:transcriptional regulator with XRE-family HTH domain